MQNRIVLIVGFRGSGKSTVASGILQAKQRQGVAPRDSVRDNYLCELSPHEPHRSQDRTGSVAVIYFIGGVQGQAPADSGAYFRQVIAKSPRLQKLVAEAKAGTHYRIAFAAGPPENFQGYTSVGEGADHNGFTVHVTAGLSRTLTENLLAHEIFHIILLKQGFPNVVYSPPSRTAGALIADAAQSLKDCYADAHIDELMSARGFTPRIINRREATLEIEDVKKGPPQPLDTLGRMNVALGAYCLSIRERDFEMEEIFSAYQRVDPTIAAHMYELERKVGSTRCKDAYACIEAMKKLRTASGFFEVRFLNPLTSAWE